MPTPRRVAVVYHYIAHYRHAVFQRLNDDPGNDVVFDFYSDDHANEKSIKTLTPEQLSRLRWHRLPNLWLTRDISWQRGLLGLALGRRCDVLLLLGNMYFLSTWVAALLARFRGKPVLMWTHGFLRRENGLKGWLRMRFYGLADRLLVYGHRGKELLVQRGYPADRVDVVYNSLAYDEQIRVRSTVTSERISARKTALFGDASVDYFTYVGRLTQDKQIDLLIDAFLEARERDPAVRLLIVGDGSARATLEERARASHHAGDIHFHGASYDEADLALLIAGSVAVVSPGPVGLSCIHALTYGAPVITNDDMDQQKPEVEAIMPGRTGTLYPARSVQGLREAMFEWLERKRRGEDTQAQCHRIIDEKYNPAIQRAIILDACRRAP